MASRRVISLRRLLHSFPGRTALTSQHTTKHNTRKVFFAFGCAITGGSYLMYRSWKHGDVSHVLPVVHARDTKEEEKVTPKMTYRELRFRQFASVESHGSIYMTPQDFLESVTEETPRPRIGRCKLSPPEVEAMLRLTPTRSRGSTKLFRNLHNKGLISYTEYLFLLCVLTKPHSGFRIAFNMFDTDGNQIVDKKEFLVLTGILALKLESFFALPSNQRKFVPRGRKALDELLALEQVFSNQPDAKGDKSNKDESLPDVQDTTLLIHFFGQRGSDVLKYDDFYRFMENLQSEVIELEFLEFSKGMNTISEVDFARILLRYTLLDKAEIDQCIDRVKERIPEEMGISFKDFKQFCQFLNNLDDFSIAMKLYTYAEQPVSQEDFQRAVKICTGFTLGKHIVNTMFQIFDVDGDGHLSHQEFISIMKDRLHRGSRSHLMHTQGNWENFRACVKNEMKTF
ncbi:calcium uptake protein 3, mitochondrial isoform X3 [Patella vulgata]|uniref:calcium uptake protein 3, mitochondrial isoform X3 n=1 Tax=Patella vulgata TaxID=6465 RepID=UPI00217F610C|nr:calcium uptake protein 3, mitochondrial isoform X3 [Patella vulgata]